MGIQYALCKSYIVNCRVCLYMDAGGDSSSSNIEIDSRWRKVIQGLLSHALCRQCRLQCIIPELCSVQFSAH